MTPKAVEQRRKAARKSRPQRLPYSEVEDQQRQQATSIGRLLNLHYMEHAQRWAGIEDKVLEIIEAEFETPAPDFERVKFALQLMPRLGELVQLKGQVWDRYGQPRRNRWDVTVEGGKRLFAEIPGDWDKPPTEDDAGAARPAGDAHNGHARD